MKLTLPHCHSLFNQQNTAVQEAASFQSHDKPASELTASKAPTERQILANRRTVEKLIASNSLRANRIALDPTALSQRDQSRAIATSQPQCSNLEAVISIKFSPFFGLCASNSCFLDLNMTIMLFVRWHFMNYGRQGIDSCRQKILFWTRWRPYIWQLDFFY